MIYEQRKLLKSRPQKPRNPPDSFYSPIFDCDRIQWIAGRFLGLQSRLWVCNPAQSPCNPPNPGAIHHNRDCEGFRNPIQSNDSHTINEDHRRIVSVAAMSMQTRAMLQSKEKSVFRHGLNHQGRCTIKTAKIAYFYVLQSGRNPIIIVCNPCRL